MTTSDKIIAAMIVLSVTGAIVFEIFGEMLG